MANKKSTGEKLTEHKLIRQAEFEANQNEPKRRGRKKTMSSDELCDAIPVRVNRRSTLKGYRGTNIFVPATQAGVHNSNLVMAELLKATITGYMENLIGFGVARSKPSDILDLARAADIATKMSANAAGFGKDKIKDIPDGEKSIFSKFFKGMKELSEGAEKEFNEEEFNQRLTKVEEAGAVIEEAGEKFVDDEQKWRAENARDMGNVYAEDVGPEGCEQALKDLEAPKIKTNPEIKKTADKEMKRQIREEMKELIEEGSTLAAGEDPEEQE